MNCVLILNNFSCLPEDPAALPDSIVACTTVGMTAGTAADIVRQAEVGEHKMLDTAVGIAAVAAGMTADTIAGTAVGTVAVEPGNLTDTTADSSAGTAAVAAGKTADTIAGTAVAVAVVVLENATESGSRSSGMLAGRSAGIAVGTVAVCFPGCRLVGMTAGRRVDRQLAAVAVAHNYIAAAVAAGRSTTVEQIECKSS